MATKAQIENLLKQFEQIHPVKFFKCMDDTMAGAGAVLKVLYESGEVLTAGRLSEELGVSTARVAVLLKKMAAKGLIDKERGVLDARITYVKLTELGTKTIQEMQSEMYRQIGIVIDTIGEERMQEFVKTAALIEDIVTPPRFN